MKARLIMIEVTIMKLSLIIFNNSPLVINIINTINTSINTNYNTNINTNNFLYCSPPHPKKQKKIAL